MTPKPDKPVTKDDVDRAFDQLNRQIASVQATADVLKALVEDIRLQRKIDEHAKSNPSHS